MDNRQLQSILGNNVVELTFERRHPKLGWSNIRGLLGSTNYPLLNSEFGVNVLNFKPPIGVGMGFDYKRYNLCVVWDMFRQEYRVFGAEQVRIRQQFPLDTPENQQAFIDYFQTYIINMSNQQKLDFMGYVGNSIVPSQLAAKEKSGKQEVPQNGYINKMYTSIYNKVKNFFKKKT